MATDHRKIQLGGSQLSTNPQFSIDIRVSMKFGRKYHLHKVPEWETHYVRYNNLKVLVQKAVSSAPECGGEVDFRGMDPSENHTQRRI